MSFEDQRKEAEAQGKELLYDDHHFLTADIDVSGPSSEKGWKDYKYTGTLENTAPAFGDIFHIHTASAGAAERARAERLCLTNRLSDDSIYRIKQ